MKKVFLIPLLFIFSILIAGNTFSEDSTGITQATFSTGIWQSIIGSIAFAAIQALLWGGYRLYLYISRVRPIIQGKWRTTFNENGDESHESVTLKQKGRQVKGKIEYLDEGKKIIYKFKGSFDNLILTATYESTDPQEIERGSFSLQYKHKQRKKLKGQYVTFSKKEDSEPEFIATEYYWERIPNE